MQVLRPEDLLFVKTGFLHTTRHRISQGNISDKFSNLSLKQKKFESKSTGDGVCVIFLSKLLQN